MQLSEMYTEPQFAALLAGQIDVGFVRDEPLHAQDARGLRLGSSIASPCCSPYLSVIPWRAAKVCG
jgi:hypothetical protein